MPTTEQISPTFADLGLSQTVLSAVADMGYETPTPVQAAAIPEVLAGRDLLAAAQTGDTGLAGAAAAGRIGVLCFAGGIALLAYRKRG